MKWLKRALITYAIVWALYSGFAVYIHKQDRGTPNFASYAWKMFQVTAAWPYYIVHGIPR